MNVLVTGGAGYVGSHVVKCLLEGGYTVVAYDNLSEGHLEAVDRRAMFVEADLKDKDILRKTLREQKIEAVIHMAAFVSVAESVSNHQKYFTNNVEYGKNLLSAMSEEKIDKIIFSSSSVVYGSREKMPISEEDEVHPENPYGETKLLFEKMLLEAEGKNGMRSISLRYFNAAGAHPSGEIGEDHHPETHLIPNVLKAALSEKGSIEVFGTDYPTKDGTAIRDYIHVSDLADAHVLSLKALFLGHKTDVFNVGSEFGYSVLDIISAAEKVSGKAIERKMRERRFGDIAVSISDSAKIRREFGWKPKFASIRSIMETAWKWHKSHPNGFREG